MPSCANMAALVRRVDSPLVTVHGDRCLLVRNRNSDCLRCADVCTTGCIHWDGGQLVISPERCIGCGTCATICPTCCLEAHHPNDAGLLCTCLDSLESGDGTIAIACGPYLDSPASHDAGFGTVRVECLGRIEESILTTLVADGAVEIRLLSAGCGTCHNRSGRTVLQDVLETEFTLLDAWGRENPIQVIDAYPEWESIDSLQADEPDSVVPTVGESRDTDREEARFGWVYPPDDRDPILPVPHVMKVMDDGTLPHFLPVRREVLLDALSSLGEPEKKPITTRLWGRIIINESLCRSCRMCTVFCPTGALRRFDGPNGVFGVEHCSGDCVACRCCEAICPGNAITVSDEVDTAWIMSGIVDRYQMRQPAAVKGKAHSIRDVAMTITNGSQVFER